MESMDKPTEPFTGGPYFSAAVAEPLAHVVPLNLSAFVAEWSESLDPVGVLADAAEWLLHERWIVEDSFVVQPFGALPLLRAATHDERLVSHFENAEGSVVFADGGTNNVRDLVATREGQESWLYYNSHGLLLGLTAVACVIGFGKCGEWLLERAGPDLDEYLEARRQERRARTLRKELLVDPSATKDERDSVKRDLEECEKQSKALLRKLRGEERPED